MKPSSLHRVSVFVPCSYCSIHRDCSQNCHLDWPRPRQCCSERGPWAAQMLTTPPLPCPLHYLGIFLRTLQCKTPECVASSSSSLLHWESSLSPKYVKVVGVVHRLAFVLIFSWWSHVPWGPTQFKQNNLLLALPSEIDDYFLIILKNDGR